VPDNTVIRMNASPQILSPYKQARKYLFEFKNILDNYREIDQPYFIPVVCYPYITYEEYLEKDLDKISPIEITILSNDLLNSDTYMKKILSIFDIVFQEFSLDGKQKYAFSKEAILQVAKIIDSSIIVEAIEGESLVNERRNKLISGSNNDYSLLVCRKYHENVDAEFLLSLVDNWQGGTKIIFFSKSSKEIEFLKNELHSRISLRNIDKHNAFIVADEGTYLFMLSYFEDIICDVIIKNGNYSGYEDLLVKLHEKTNFNKDQYDIEHADLENLIVKAGAGTGKTYSLISRINFLIWKKSYTPIELKSKISMITFTNEAADSIKSKITENFLNYFILTQQPRFADYVDVIENMNIGTIHSISKKILVKYASQIGYGKDIKIITGKYKKEEFLRNNLDLLVGNGNFPQGISNYFLTQRLIELMDKFDNKNIDIENDWNSLKFGREIENPDFSFLEVIRKTQIQMNEYSIKSNSICLGDLIRIQKKICISIKNKKNEINPVDFLFVDEFQDTDDVQIDLIKQFQNVFGYKLLVVGDIKQCIYRFRGAEVKAFDKLKNCSTEEFLEISLRKNYRTHSQLLDELNSIFKRWDEMQLIEYRNEDVLSWTKNGDDRLSRFEFIEHLDNFEQIFIQDLRERKRSLTKGGKIAILTRFNYQVQEVKKLCESNGIAVDTETGGELFRIDPTVDFYKLVLALENSKSSEYLFNLYTTSYTKSALPKVEILYISREEVTEYFYKHLPEELMDWEKYLEQLHKEPVLKVLREIVEHVKPWQIFAEKIGKTSEDKTRLERYYLQNLDQLFEKLVENSNSEYITLNRIRGYLDIMILAHFEEESRASFNVENSVHDIICTTVHKSKGLEFETIILPFTNTNISGERNKGKVDIMYLNSEVGYRINSNENPSKVSLKNDIYDKYLRGENVSRNLEEARILYVALTRAVKNIVVHIQEVNDRNPGRTKNTWERLIGRVNK